MKHLDPNDPRFTAKALGEDEAQDINPEANEEFDSLQSFADTLKAELKANDEGDVLTEEQKERVRSAVEKKQKKVLRFPVWINAVAACLVLGLLGIITYHMIEPFNTPMLSGGKEDLERMIAEQEEIRRRQTAAPEGTGSASEVVDVPTTSIPQIRIVEEDLGAPEQEPRPAPILLQSVPKESILADFDDIAGRAESFETIPLREAEISSLEEQGYVAPSTLAGTKVESQLKDIGAAIATLSNQHMEDAGATDAKQTIQFGLAAEEAGNDANFAGGERAKRELSFRSNLVEDRLATPVPAAKPKVISYDEYKKQHDVRLQQEPWNREAYDRLVENTFKNPTDHPLSTFSIDVDTASYSNVRRYLNNGHLPPADVVRIEEMINYFSYDYEGPKEDTPFAVHVDAATAPWNEDHRLVRIGLQGDVVDESERPDANLVFLIDVSGSMSNQNKLPLVQRSMNLLVDQMEARDRIAVVVYAGASGLALPSTTANNKETIQHAISNLKSGGSTNGGAGIELAYSVAQKHFIEDGINRVILCTDGDFNVGTSDRGSLTRLIEEKAKTGVFFSVLGFGTGNYQDATMEELSNKGNGNYGYVDSFKEARKVFVDEMLGTLYTIAKDVKIQVEFNPQHVGSYRLIGYENRMLAKEDFNDDTKDAGEIGAGHRVTALYEIVPPSLAEGTTPTVDPLKYQATTEPVVKSSEMLTVKLHYKQPDEDVSSLIEQPFVDNGSKLNATDDDFRFATSVASFGMLLKNSELIADMSYEDVLELAQQAKGNDSGGLRSEFIELVEKVISFQPTQEASEPEER